jgi:uroporphyrinogen-III C-methyltransferase (EC 2.1.1.107)
MTTAEAGVVYLVGAGPGDPGLLTVRAAELLEAADVVLHDKLPGADIIAAIPPEKREDVGKRAGGEWTPQAYTNHRMVELARAGRSVVRLKGGDPFVFGRGGEEMEALAAAEVPFEVVPGVSSAVAAPALAGIPLTHREHASEVTFVTGHEDPTKPSATVGWGQLAQTDGTLVILMGVGKLEEYAPLLLAGGRAGSTPLAFIERAGWPQMRVLTTTLAEAVSVRDARSVEPPAVIVIGAVAAIRATVQRWLRGWEDTR